MMLALRVGTTLRDAQAAVIRGTILACGGNKKAAAKVLGVSRRSLYAHDPAAQAPDAAPPLATFPSLGAALRAYGQPLSRGPALVEAGIIRLTSTGFEVHAAGALPLKVK